MNAWTSAIGRRPAGNGVLAWYNAHVLELSGDNPRVLTTFLEVMHLTRSPFALFSPGVLLPVLVNFDRTQLVVAESLGATPSQAFYVKCDAETNPPEVIEAGQVICEIGIAPVKPAEFVIFRLSQFTGGSGEAEVAE